MTCPRDAGPENTPPPGAIRRAMAGIAEPGDRPIPIIRMPALVASFGLARPSIVTCHRWARYGHAGIRLSTSSDGRKVYTTVAAIKAFIKEAGIK